MSRKNIMTLGISATLIVLSAVGASALVAEGDQRSPVLVDEAVDADAARILDDGTVTESEIRSAVLSAEECAKSSDLNLTVENDLSYEFSADADLMSSEEFLERAFACDSTLSVVKDSYLFGSD